MGTTKQTKTGNKKMKFQTDKQYSWVFSSESFKINEHNNYGIEERIFNEIGRFQYSNYYGFSAYDKPRTECGIVANFSLIFQVEDVYTVDGGVCVKGKKYWRDVEHIGNFETKKDMLECINTIMEKFNGEGWKQYGSYVTYKIKERI